jgi:hypothetical protein
MDRLLHHKMRSPDLIGLLQHFMEFNALVIITVFHLYLSTLITCFVKCIDQSICYLLNTINILFA